MSSMSERPVAITMWDFSWLERRWPGAGYEDWDLALDQLAERGYNAVRIDAYPHLVSADPYRSWELLPVWNQQSWGAQSLINVQVQPSLVEFIGKCRDRGIAVGLSTWYRQDRDDVRMRIRTPEDQARIWIDTLRHIEDAGLLESILYVDLCNEYPLDVWAPYLYTDGLPKESGRNTPKIQSWMDESIEMVRSAYPQLDYTYSFCSELLTWQDQDVRSLDLLEPHIWMAGGEVSDFYERVGYHFERFESVGYDNLVANGRRIYEDSREHWDGLLYAAIDSVADWSRATSLPLVTTECWSVVDYKDWPGLDWDWIMELTAKGLRHAAATGRWVGMATSNFCGPQFVGMWRDVAWHQELTTLIKNSPIDADLQRVSVSSILRLYRTGRSETRPQARRMCEVGVNAPLIRRSSGIALSEGSWIAMGLRRYLANKTVWYLGALVVAVVLNFVLPRLIPGNPVDVLVSKMGQGGLSSEAQQRTYEAFMREFGLDKPIWDQFVLYITGVFHGNFGASFSFYPTPVSSLIAQSVPYTLALQLPAIVLGWIIGNLLGAIAAYKGGGWDKSVFTTALLFNSTPYYCLSIILLYVFGVVLGWFPVGGAYSLGSSPEWSWDVLLRRPHVLVFAVRLACAHQHRRPGRRHALDGDLRTGLRLRELLPQPGYR